MDYKMNLNGIVKDDIVQCENGHRFKVVQFSPISVDDPPVKLERYAIGRVQAGAVESLHSRIYHSEKDNNCWKSYKQGQ